MKHAVFFLATVLLGHLHAGEYENITFDSKVQSVLLQECSQINWTAVLLGFGLCYAVHRMYKHEAQIRDFSDSLEQCRRDLDVQKSIIVDHSRTLLGPNYKEFDSSQRIRKESIGKTASAS